MEKDIYRQVKEYLKNKTVYCIYDVGGYYMNMVGCYDSEDMAIMTWAELSKSAYTEQIYNDYIKKADIKKKGHWYYTIEKVNLGKCVQAMIDIAVYNAKKGGD